MNAMLPDRKLFHPKVLRRPTEDAHYFKIKINIEMRRTSQLIFSVFQMNCKIYWKMAHFWKIIGILVVKTAGHKLNMRMKTDLQNPIDPNSNDNLFLVQFKSWYKSTFHLLLHRALLMPKKYTQCLILQVLQPSWPVQWIKTKQNVQ